MTDYILFKHIVDTSKYDHLPTAVKKNIIKKRFELSLDYIPEEEEWEEVIQDYFEDDNYDYSGIYSVFTKDTHDRPDILLWKGEVIPAWYHHL